MTASNSKPSPIRVLVVDDSACMRTALSRMIESDPQLAVVGTAQNGLEALEKAVALDPDVVTLDIEMPGLDGLSALRQLMRENPRPVIVVSSLSQEGAEATLEAFDLGAFDCIPKQVCYTSLDIMKIRNQLVAKLKEAAAANHIRRRGTEVPPAQPPELAPESELLPCPAPAVVAIGASTGGPRALQQVLPALPADLPMGLLVVQHMPPGFTGPFARRLDALSALRVCEAVHQARIEPGVVLLAPAGRHMTVARRTHSTYEVRLSDNPADTLHIPSVDVLMLSAAEAYGPLTMGVILTGMGNDGAHGMKSIFEKGGLTVGQDQASSVVYGMPRACAELGVLRRLVPLAQIAGQIVLASRARQVSCTGLPQARRPVPPVLL